MNPEILLQCGAVLLLGLITWLGQWGRRNVFARWAVYIWMVFCTIGLAIMAGATYFVWKVQPHLMPSENMTKGLLFMTGMALFGFLLGLIHPAKRLILGVYKQIFKPEPLEALALADISTEDSEPVGSNSSVSTPVPEQRTFLNWVFPGYKANAPDHAWMLGNLVFIFAMFIATMTWLYDPDVFIEAFKSTPLAQAVPLNMVSFVIFSFLGAGIWITRTPKEACRRLGLTGITRLTLLKMTILAVIVMLAVHVFEVYVSPYFLTATQEAALEKISNAMRLNVGFPGVIGIALIIAIGAGVGEEILFRGYLQPIFGMLPTAILFAVMHAHYGPTIVLVELFGIGLLMGYLRYKYNTTAAIVVHLLFDFLAVMQSALFHQGF